MKFVISRYAYEKIQYWMHKTNKEVSGLGEVEIIDGVPYISDVYLLDQTVTGTETDLDPTDICKFLTEYYTNGNDGEIKFWWHSHVNMSCEWSSTDEKTIKQLASKDWFCNAVFNKRGEYRATFADYSVLGKNGLEGFYNTRNDEVKLQIDEQLDESFYKELDEQFKKKVNEKVYKANTTTWNHHTRNWDNKLQGNVVDIKNEVETMNFVCEHCNHIWNDEEQTWVCPKCNGFEIDIFFDNNELGSVEIDDEVRYFCGACGSLTYDKKGLKKCKDCQSFVITEYPENVVDNTIKK